MREIIEKGYLYISCPPKYKIVIDKDTTEYAFDEQARDEILKKYNNKYSNITYLKGLGEMNPEQLAETTMDKDKRILKQITLEDITKASLTLNNLMGESVTPRKEFIEKNALKANLDI